MDNIQSSLGPQHCGGRCPTCGTNCRHLVHHSGGCECPGCGQTKFTIDPVGTFATEPPAQSRSSYVETYGSSGSAASSTAADGSGASAFIWLAWNLIKPAFWALVIVVVCALVAAVVATIIVASLSAVVIASVAVWLRLYVDPALIRVQVRLLKWAALIGGVGGAGLV